MKQNYNKLVWQQKQKCEAKWNLISTLRCCGDTVGIICVQTHKETKSGKNRRQLFRVWCLSCSRMKDHTWLVSCRFKYPLTTTRRLYLWWGTTEEHVCTRAFVCLKKYFWILFLSGFTGALKSWIPCCYNFFSSFKTNQTKFSWCTSAFQVFKQAVINEKIKIKHKWDGLKKGTFWSRLKPQTLVVINFPSKCTSLYK